MNPVEAVHMHAMSSSVDLVSDSHFDWASDASFIKEVDAIGSCSLLQKWPIKVVSIESDINLWLGLLDVLYEALDQFVLIRHVEDSECAFH